MKRRRPEVIFGKPITPYICLEGLR